MGVTNAKAGLRLNGVIESYVAGSGGINAGDFAKYVNGAYGTDTAVNSGTISTGRSISAVALDSTHVFIAHSRTSNHYLYGVVCTISGSTITVGTDTAINSNTVTTGHIISAVLLDSTHVFIAHSYISFHLYGVVCTVSGTTITVGTDTAISTITYSGRSISAVALDSTHVFIAHQHSDSDYSLYGIVCTISGTTVTVGTNTAISTLEQSGDQFSAVLLDSTHVFIAHPDTAARPILYGIVCTVSGTTITHGTDRVINSTEYMGAHISAGALDSTHVFIAHSHYGTVCTIDGTTITHGTTTTMYSTGSYIVYVNSVVILNSAQVTVVYSLANSNQNKFYLYDVNCTVNGSTITVGTNTEIDITNDSGYAISAIPADSFGTIFVAHSYSSSDYLYAIAKTYDSVVTVSSSSDTILGVSKQTKAEGEAVNIVVPDV